MIAPNLCAEHRTGLGTLEDMAIGTGLLPDKATEVKTDPGHSEKGVNPGQNPPAVLRNTAAASATGKPKKEKSGLPHN